MAAFVVGLAYRPSSDSTCLPLAAGGGGEEEPALEPVEPLDVELPLAPELDEELSPTPVKGSNSSATWWGVARAADAVVLALCGRAALVVIKFEADPRAAAVLSGWGDRSQWFRNLQAAPPLAVEIGGEGWRSPRFEVLEPDRVVEVVEEYRRNHRLLMSSLDRFFGWPRNASEEERRRMARDLCVVVFSPASESEARDPAAGLGRPEARTR